MHTAKLWKVLFMIGLLSRMTVPANATANELRQVEQFNLALSEIEMQMAQIKGSDGFSAAISGDIDMGGKTFTNVGRANSKDSPATVSTVKNNSAYADYPQQAIVLPDTVKSRDVVTYQGTADRVSNVQLGSNVLSMQGISISDSDVLSSTYSSLRITGDTSGPEITITFGGNTIVIDGGTFGVNGLDTGTMAQDTPYYVHLLISDDKDYAGLLSLSATNPTMPEGYNYSKLIGYVHVFVLNPGYHVYYIPFKQIKQDWFFRTYYTLKVGTDASYTEVDASGYCPIADNLVDGLYISIGVSSYVSGNIAVSLSNDGYNELIQSSVVSAALGIGPQVYFFYPIFDDTVKLYYKKNGVGTGNAAVYLMGFRLNL